jgi:hypothetical protein
MSISEILENIVNKGNCSPTPVMEKAMFINVIRAGGILDAMQ